MNEEERNELLISIKVKLDNLVAELQKVSNGTGFPRCVEREQRIMRLEQDVIEMKPKVQKIEALAMRLIILETNEAVAKTKKEKINLWFMRITWAAVIIGVIKLAFFQGGQIVL